MSGSCPIRPLALPLLLATVLFTGGCSVGQIQIVPMLRADIQPREPLVASLEPQEGWYWKGENGRLNVVLARHDRSLIDKNFDSRWAMSLVLEDLPAGRERLYRANPRTARFVQSFGGSHRRAKSASGVVVIERTIGGRFKGRFHLLVRQQQFTALNGWGPPLYRAPLAIMVGRFEMRPDAARGKLILERTEADGFDRLSDELATTLPAARIVIPATTTAPR